MAMNFQVTPPGLRVPRIQLAGVKVIEDYGMSNMKTQKIKKTLIAISVGAALTASGNVAAQDNNIMLGFNPFGGSAAMPSMPGQAAPSVPSVGAPDYMVGIRMSEELMPFAFGSINDPGGDADTQLTIGGGMRYYMQNISDNVRPFLGGAAGIISAEETGFGLGGFFGAEAMITDGFSVSGQLGLDITDPGGDADTQFTLGSANVMFNLYF